MRAAAPTTSSASARAMWCAPAAGSRRLAEIGDIVVAAQRRYPGPRQGRRRCDDRTRFANRQRQHERARDRARHRRSCWSAATAAPSRRRRTPRSTRSTVRCRPASAPRRCLNRTAARRRHRPHRGDQPRWWGRLLVVLVLLLLLGNFRAALITALVIPVTMLITAHGHAAAQAQRQPDEPRRARFRADRRRRGHHRGEQPAASVGAPARARPRASDRASASTPSRRRRAKSSGRPCTANSSSRSSMCRLLTFSGVEGKTFQPMALTVIIALATAFVLSLTFMPAMIAIVLTGKVDERENRFVRGLKALYRPVLAGRHPQAAAGHRGRSRAVRRRGAAVHAARPGIHPEARREEHRHGGEADSEHVAVAVAGDAIHQRKHDRKISAGGFRVLPRRHAGPRGGSDAAERDRHLHHPEAPAGVARSGSAQGRSDPRDRRAGRESSPATRSASRSRSRCASTS